MLNIVQLKPYAKRKPHQLSGGQQQRVALARALAKGAPLMLLDEPLVNLDYKLREELREELTQLFAAGDSTVIYATTEPGEAKRVLRPLALSQFVESCNKGADYRVPVRVVDIVACSMGIEE